MTIDEADRIILSAAVSSPDAGDVHTLLSR